MAEERGGGESNRSTQHFSLFRKKVQAYVCSIGCVCYSFHISHVSKNSVEVERRKD